MYPNVKERNGDLLLLGKRKFITFKLQQTSHHSSLLSEATFSLSIAQSTSSLVPSSYSVEYKFKMGADRWKHYGRKVVQAEIQCLRQARLMFPISGPILAKDSRVIFGVLILNGLVEYSTTREWRVQHMDLPKLAANVSRVSGQWLRPWHLHWKEHLRSTTVPNCPPLSINYRIISNGIEESDEACQYLKGMCI